VAGCRGAGGRDDHHAVRNVANLHLVLTKTFDVCGEASLRVAGHHDALANPHKLMDRRITPEDGIASDAHMAAQRKLIHALCAR
jgi:hypothetical protein